MIGLSRTASIVAAIVLGALVPQAHVAAPLIKWLVMAMLFLVFMEIRLEHLSLQRSHWILLAANIGLALGAWRLGQALAGRDVALAAFFSGITPTAAAAPVIISFLRGRVEYVLAAFLLTNVVTAALLPLLLPLVLGHPTASAFAHVLGSVGLVVFGPMLAAGIIRSLAGGTPGWARSLRHASFGMWVTGIFLITANASNFVRQQEATPLFVLAQIAGVSLLVCAASFAAGHWIGRPHFSREASQALGQKNNALTIYLALAHADPVVALGPTFYVVWHNLWNSWQLHRMAQRDKS